MRVTASATELPASAPPSEFRIFRAGRNETSKGVFTFDAESARSVMEKARLAGNDLPIDYEHASLKPFAMDPAESGKAAGWFKLEVRAGELWAVGVKWTKTALEKLLAREFRYTSPTFHHDDKNRVLELVNVALTNLPATHRLDPLMATRLSRPGGEAALTSEDLQVARALGIDPARLLAHKRTRP